MEWLSTLTRPFIRLLTWSTNATLSVIGLRKAPDRSVTEEEIAASLEEGLDAGVIEAQEHQMVRNVFRLDDRQVNSMMIPRGEIVWLEATSTADDVLRVIGDAEHSRYPVCRSGLDDVLGVITAQKLLQRAIKGEAFAVDQDLQPPVFVPGDALRHGAARALPRLERADRLRRRRIRRGAGNDHRARRPRGDHRRVLHGDRGRRVGRCSGATAAGCSTASSRRPS
jgi:Mg2+/Co2+ transporter CorB